MSRLSTSGYEALADPSSVPLRIFHIKIQGTIVRASTADKPRIVHATLNNPHPGGVNTITPAALDHIIDPAKLYMHQDIEVGWRLQENGTLFTSLHRVVPEATGHGISFAGNLDWTNPITDLVARFDQYAAQREAAAARSAHPPYVYQPNYVESPPRRIRSPLVERSLERGTTQRLRSGAVGRATAPQLRDQRRRQVSQRLVEARQQHAQEEYLATGNTREILRAMELTQVVAASALQQCAAEERGDEWWDV